MGALGVLLWGRWAGQPVWAALTVAAAGALVAVAMIDWDTFLIPDELSLGLALAGVLAAPVNPFFISGSWPLSMGKALAGALIGFFICWGAAAAGEFLFKKEAMGGGDVKLMAGIGAWTGGLGAFDAIMLASFLGSIYGLSLMAKGALKRSDPIPFGPFLSAAAVFNFFLRLPLGFPFVTF
jgi:leader peptidase (prepilin peptidase)/N-methyltransferase